MFIQHRIISLHVLVGKLGPIKSLLSERHLPYQYQDPVFHISRRFMGSTLNSQTTPPQELTTLSSRLPIPSPATSRVWTQGKKMMSKALDDDSNAANNRVAVAGACSRGRQRWWKCSSSRSQCGNIAAKEMVEML